MTELTVANLESALENPKILPYLKGLEISFAPMIFTESDVAKRNRRVLLVLIAGLSLGVLSGCGGAWQPDSRDMPKSPAASSAEASGIRGPEDSR